MVKCFHKFMQVLQKTHSKVPKPFHFPVCVHLKVGSVLYMLFVLASFFFVFFVLHITHQGYGRCLCASYTDSVTEQLPIKGNLSLLRIHLCVGYSGIRFQGILVYFVLLALKFLFVMSAKWHAET